MTTEHPAIVLKNTNDLVWEPMAPELGPHSPRFATLRSDARTDETTIVIELTNNQNPYLSRAQMTHAQFDGLCRALDTIAIPADKAP